MSRSSVKSLVRIIVGPFVLSKGDETFDIDPSPFDKNAASSQSPNGKSRLCPRRVPCRRATDDTENEESGKKDAHDKVDNKHQLGMPVFSINRDYYNYREKVSDF